MKTLLLCALLLQAEVSPPASLVALYDQAFSCSATAPRSPATVPAERVNDHFIGSRGVWPVLSLEALESQRSRWVAGASPGLLLDDLAATLGDLERQERLRQAVALGARPVVVLEQPSPLRQRDLLMAWCSLGLCPAAFHLPRGVTQRLGDLLPATYLSAPWMAGVPEWPLPQRHLELGGRHLLVLLPGDEVANGRVAQRGVPAAHTSVHAPALQPIRWQVGGIDFHLEQGRLESGGLGNALLALYRVSLTLWPLLGQDYTRLVLWASLGFAWLSLMLMLFNLAWLGTGIWRLLRTRPQSRSGERHEPG